MAIVDVWPIWASQTSASNTTTSITTGDCFTIWVVGRDDGTTGGGDVWQVWAGNSATTIDTNASTYVSPDYAWQYWNRVPTIVKPTVIPAKILSPEEIAARDAKLKAEEERRKAEQERIARYEEQIRGREKASAERAMLLLKEFLNEQQRKELEKHKHVRVVGSKGKTTYLIEVGGRVYELADETTKVASYCIHSRDMCYPEGDEVLAKILLLQADEDKFLKTANKTVLLPATR